MKHYLRYTVEELSLDQDFIDWICKGKNDPAWQAFLDQYPEMRSPVQEAGQLVKLLQPNAIQTGFVDMDAELERLMVAIDPANSRQEKSRWNWQRFLFAAAAMVTALLVLLFVVEQQNSAEQAFSYTGQTAQRKLVEQVNSTDQPIDIHLPDGSLVKLSPNSRFSYAASFNDSANRDVYLNGQAFFEVARNAQKPFRVFSNEIVTKVLGTSFTVRSFESETDIEVVVRTGKVNVFRQAHEGVLLTANQRALYRKKGKNIIKQLNEKPVIISSRISSRQMVFEEVPVREVLQLIGEAYGISIHCEMELLKGCTLTADLTDESIYKKLDLICRAINAGYEIIDSEVYIYPKGCQ